MTEANSANLYPPIEPYHSEYLKVSDIHEIYYELSGRPDGTPVLFLHGGPGAGTTPACRQFFDPEFYKIILVDQRGAGKSRPFAELAENTTWDIVKDLERLRKALNIEQWLLFGGSWGSTLALCYGIQYPDAVLGMILRGVFLARPFEIDWLYKKGGLSLIYPDEWALFTSCLNDADKNHPPKAYYALLTKDDVDVRQRAAASWARWEAASMMLFSEGEAVNALTQGKIALSLARIECHYAVNSFFLPTENFVLENSKRLENTPLKIIQGRYDLITPVQSAWDLHKAVPNSELTIIIDGAHYQMEPSIANALTRAAEQFKAERTRSEMGP